MNDAEFKNVEIHNNNNLLHYFQDGGQNGHRNLNLMYVRMWRWHFWRQHFKFMWKLTFSAIWFSMNYGLQTKLYALLKVSRITLIVFVSESRLRYIRFKFSAAILAAILEKICNCCYWLLHIWALRLLFHMNRHIIRRCIWKQSWHTLDSNFRRPSWPPSWKICNCCNLFYFYISELYVFYLKWIDTSFVFISESRAEKH